MKIGDRVRFLNAVGGGIVRKFKNKDIVIVEEDDGFETPVLARECIVIETNANNYTIKNAPSPAKQEAEKVSEPMPEEEKYEVVELSGKERLNLFLAFLPMDIKKVGDTTYETYLVNDSNYFLFFNYMSRSNNSWISRHAETIEPNTRLFIEEFSKEQINELEKVCIQFIAFKKDKPYSLKDAYSVELKIDGVKFYKLHSFKENEFFEDEALIYPVVRNDSPERELLISATDLQKAMTEKDETNLSKQFPVYQSSKRHTEIIEIDLHIHQLLDSTAGLGNADMLQVQMDKFREIMQANIGKKGQKIVFIHGKGEGVLRKALLDELKHKYKNCLVQDASFKEYGFGATAVTIR